jgi:flagellar assembly protein FliH
MSALAKFLFDVDFANGDAAASHATITRAEHAVKLAEAESAAYRNGLETAKADEERRIAAAMDRIAESLAVLSRSTQGLEAKFETEAVEVAVAVAKKLAAALLVREPLAEIAALTVECLRHLVAAPHVAVQVNDGLYEAAAAQLNQVATASGFAGRLVILADPEIKPGDCRIEWADGGIKRDREAIETEIGQSVRRYLQARTPIDPQAEEIWKGLSHE